MNVLKLLFYCLSGVGFVLNTHAQIVDSTSCYQIFEEKTSTTNSFKRFVLKNKKGQVIVVCRSVAFSVEGVEEIQAKNAQVTLYLHGPKGGLDSITHPNLHFHYYTQKRSLLLEISSDSNYPDFYKNSLQKVEIKARKIEWEIDKDQLYFDNNKNKIELTSFDYYKASLMEAYQSLGNTNPLVKMVLYAQKKGFKNAWVGLEEMSLLLSKDLEGVVFMDSTEIKKAATNPTFKIIREQQDFSLFRKGYPNIFRYAGIDVCDIKRLVRVSTRHQKVLLPLYLRMMKDGFLLFDKSKKKIQFQEKAFHYVAAMNRQSNYDYDHLKFWASPSKEIKVHSVVSLNLNTQNLLVSKVNRIVFGMSQNVFAKPFDKIYWLSNRNIQFDGELWAGTVGFIGRDFLFEYNSNSITMPKIEQMKLGLYRRERVENQWRFDEVQISSNRAIDKEGKLTDAVEFIQSEIEGINGYLTIDTLNNKSGEKQKRFQGVSFVSSFFSRVYYDKRLLDNQPVYPRKEFYYELEPFQLNRINKLEFDDFLFKGKFYSDKIFQVFEIDLKLQLSDLSLGLDTVLERSSPVPIYIRENSLGKGTFNGNLVLSNSGLLGNGQLRYLGASLICDVFDFLPEMVEAKQVDSFTLKPSLIFPRAKARHVKMHWKPYKNKMFVSSLFTTGFPFCFYYNNQKYFLDGQIIIGPKGVEGRGTLDWMQASLVSNPNGDYKIGTNVITSTSASVLLKISGQYQYGLEQENVAFKLDFNKKRAHFISQDIHAEAKFPYNEYQTNCNNFYWDWEWNKLLIQMDNNRRGLFFREGKFGKYLYFKAKRGLYDLNTGWLELQEVAPIEMGNTTLYLKDSILKIGSNAYIEQLSGKLLIGNSLSPMYTIDSIALVWDEKANIFASKGRSFLLRKKGEGQKKVDGKILLILSEKGLLVKYGWTDMDGNWCFFRWENGRLTALSNWGAIEGINVEKKKTFDTFKTTWF